MDSGKVLSSPRQASENNRNARKRIWEIAPEFFCSLCGTCLGLDEQRLILKKLDMPERTLTDHEIHALMVQSLYSENKLSRRLESFLNQKYRYEISRCRDYDEEQFMVLWREQAKSGDICGLYWAALSRDTLSGGSLHSIFCDVHMMSHLNGGRTRQEKAEYERMSQVNSRLSDKLVQAKKQIKDMSRNLSSSAQIIRDLEAKIRHMEKYNGQETPRELTENRDVKCLEDEKQELEKALQQVRNDLQQARELAAAFKQEKRELEAELVLTKEINTQLYQEITTFLQEPYCGKTGCALAPCDGELCEKRVLIVGGITKLRNYYRDLVENRGGSFVYHDGYLRSGERELESLIKKSDIVLCPVDCNSHGACLCVKKICSRINKPYHMLPSSSLNSISQALSVSDLSKLPSE